MKTTAVLFVAGALLTLIGCSQRPSSREIKGFAVDYYRSVQSADTDKFLSMVHPSLANNIQSNCPGFLRAYHESQSRRFAKYLLRVDADDIRVHVLDEHESLNPLYVNDIGACLDDDVYLSHVELVCRTYLSNSGADIDPTDEELHAYHGCVVTRCLVAREGGKLFFAFPPILAKRTTSRLDVARSSVSNTLAGIRALTPIVLRALDVATYRGGDVADYGFPLLVVSTKPESDNDRLAPTHVDVEVESDLNKVDMAYPTYLASWEYQAYCALLSPEEELHPESDYSSSLVKEYEKFTPGNWRYSRKVWLPLDGQVILDPGDSPDRHVSLVHYPHIAQLKSVLVYDVLSSEKVGVYTDGSDAKATTLGACVVSLENMTVRASRTFQKGPPQHIFGGLGGSGYSDAKRAMIQWASSPNR